MKSDNISSFCVTKKNGFTCILKKQDNRFDQLRNYETKGGSALGLNVRLHTTPEKASQWQIDKRIFGKFFEMNGRDTYPGIIDDCIANGSFEFWFSKRKKDGTNLPWTMRTEIMYRDTPQTPGLAYPWEPVFDQAGAFEQLQGGVHGKPSWKCYQRIKLTDGVRRRGIMQRITLADEQTLEYRLQFYARVSGACTRLHTALEDKAGVKLSVSSVELTGNWKRYDLRLTMEQASEFRYADSPFGEYRLSLIADADGESTVDLDWVMLTSGDAVEGMFNRATIELLKRYNVTSIRWGGNYANEYNWKDGIGPWQERPVRDNQNWGGLEPNYMGTNEFLRFCQLIQAEPFLNVGFSCDLPPELAAQWVEYVNGDITTPMGRLRAEHGYPEPWGVKLWQVGNESYGDYQFGYTNSIDFSNRIQTYYTMMKNIDPSITIIMAGEDPMYVDYSEIPGEPPIWNKRMFEIAGPAYIDGLDIHQYTRGIRDEGLRKEWLASHAADPAFYNQVLVSYPTQYEANIQELKEMAKEYGFEKLSLEIGEWNLEPETDMNWPKAEFETMAHACYVASMFNTFIRQGDTVKYAYQRDNTLYYRAYPVDMRPVNPGNDTSRLYAEPFLRCDTNWRRLELETEGSSFTMPQTWVRIRPMEQVPHVDAAAVISERNDEIILFLVNRDLSLAHTVHVEGEWLTGEVKSSVLLQYADSPFLRHTDWYAKNGYQMMESQLAVASDGRAAISLPAGSVARVSLSFINI
jgi:alpha-N-arabinofuranosidase